jgi:hypothetical protein
MIVSTDALIKKRIVAAKKKHLSISEYAYKQIVYDFLYGMALELNHDNSVAIYSIGTLYWYQTQAAVIGVGGVNDPIRNLKQYHGVTGNALYEKHFPSGRNISNKKVLKIR